MEYSFEHNIQKIFYCDGSYRDIYVRHVTKDDWRNFIDFVKIEWPIQFYEDGIKVDYYNLKVDQIFSLTNNHAILMIIYLNTLSVNCNFFSVEEIELDIDPREVLNIEVYNWVIDFIKKLSRALNKEVRLTPENCPDYSILRCYPNSEVEYLNIE